MKYVKVLLILFIVFHSNYIFSQKLTLEQLITLSNKEEDEIDLSLTKDGWELFHDKNLDEPGLRQLVWVYGQASVVGSISGQKYATAWLQAQNERYNRVIRYTCPLDEFNAIRRRILDIKMQKTGYKNEGNIITYQYTGKNYIALLITNIEDNNSINVRNNIYTVVLRKK